MLLEQLTQEYYSLVRQIKLDRENLDYTLVNKHIEAAEKFCKSQGSCMSIFDMNKYTHAWESANHDEWFKDENNVFGGIQIHPEDIEAVYKSGIMALKYVYQNNSRCRDIKLIREYRAYIFGSYRRITEQFIVLESDSRNNAWLTLSVVDVSPDQSSPFVVNAKLVDIVRGEVFIPLDYTKERDNILSKRELEILKWIECGKLSKEIAEELHISIATVNNHRQHILEKLQIDNSMEAVRYAQMLGLLTE